MNWRNLAFTFLFYGWTILLCIFGLPVLLMPRAAVLWYARFWLKGVAWLEQHILGLRYRLLGAEHLPKDACIIAAKHQSAWETMKFHLLFQDPVIVLKQELSWIPLWGWYTMRAGMVPINRSKGSKALRVMLKSAKHHAAHGRQIIIFPQGTRLAPGQISPYKPGVAALYEALQLPVIPMALNSGLFWPKRGAKRNGEVTVEFLPPIPPGLSRAEFMARLEHELEFACQRLPIHTSPSP